MSCAVQCCPCLNCQNDNLNEYQAQSLTSYSSGLKGKRQQRDIYFRQTFECEGSQERQLWYLAN